MALVRADYGRLDELRRRAALVASPAFTEEVTRRLAATATKLLADEFRNSRDPYGRPWKPVFRNRIRDRRARARGGARARKADKPLRDTGRLMAAAIAAPQASGTTVRVLIPVEYASYHQEGTSRIAQRQIVPDAAGGLGPIWTQAFERETKAAYDEVMEGAR